MSIPFDWYMLLLKLDMSKNNSENLKNTIVSKMNAAQDSDELRKVSKDLIEWVDWLKLNGKISNTNYSELRNLITVHESSKKNEWNINSTENKKNYVDGKRTWMFVFVLLTCVTIGFIILGFIRVVSLSEVADDNITTIPFRGTLKDAEGQPIDSKTDVVFRLYTQPEGSMPLYEGRCIGTDGLVPDYRGEFTVVLGADCNMKPLDESVLENKVLFLGVTIGSGEEIKTRYRILSSTYSHDSAQVAGRTVGTEENNIPFINGNGEVIIDASNPVIKATSGDFLIQGASVSLKTDSGGEGDITIQPNAGGSVIIPSGNMGLGVFEPNAKLEIAGVEPYQTIARITNLSIDDSGNGNVLSLGVGTLKEGKNAKFITFNANVTKEDSGTEIGSIRLNNEAVTYETKGADFAEYFDTAFNYPVGTIISLSKRGIDIAYKNETVVGVSSDRAGFVGNSKSDSANSLLVGLIGQVDVFVTTENGNIKTGDAISIGKIPGHGVKGNARNIVGYALEDMDSLALSSNFCPEKFRRILDSSEQPIQCGRLKIFLRPE